MQRVVYAHHLRYGLPIILSEAHGKWVEMGLARYRVNSLDAAYDEALPHLAVEHWMRTDQKRAVARLQHYGLNANPSKPDDNELENVAALYIAHIFSEWIKLEEVMHFLEFGDGDFLRRRRARLVAFNTDSSGKPYHSPASYPLDKPGRSPSHILGFSARSDDDVLKWLRHDPVVKGAPMCFPSTKMGPDILFWLEIEGLEMVISVALRAIFHASEAAMSPTQIIQALSSVTPTNFFTAVNCSRYFL
jgi:hypothetical protein